MRPNVRVLLVTLVAAALLLEFVEGASCPADAVCFGTATEGTILSVNPSDSTPPSPTPATVVVEGDLKVAGGLQVSGGGCVEGPINGNECHMRRRDPVSGLCWEEWTEGMVCGWGRCSMGRPSACQPLAVFQIPQNFIHHDSPATLHVARNPMAACLNNCSQICLTWRNSNRDLSGNVGARNSATIVCSLDGGRSWRSPISTHYDTLPFYDTWPQVAALNGGFIHIFAYNSASNIYFRFSSDFLYWPFAHDIGDARTPFLATNGRDRALVAWHVNSNNHLGVVTTENGVDWTDIAPHATYATYGQSVLLPTITYHDSEFVITVLQYSDGTIVWFRYSDDLVPLGSQSLAPLKASGGIPRAYSILMENTMVVTYQATIGGTTTVHTARFDLSGTMQSSVVLTTHDTPFLGLTMEVAADRTLVVSSRTRMFISQDEGATWTAAVDLGTSPFVTMSTDGDYFLVPIASRDTLGLIVTTNITHALLNAEPFHVPAV